MEYTPLEITFNTVQILMSNFDTLFECTECCNMVTVENSYNLIAIMKSYLSNFLCGNAVPMRFRPTTLIIIQNTITIMTIYCLSVRVPASQVPNHKIHKELQYNEKVG